jgi:hypothetical protein
MRLHRQIEDQVDLRLSVDELAVLRNALNEFCNGMHLSEDDFLAILDVARPEAEAVLLRLEAMLERVRFRSGDE